MSIRKIHDVEPLIERYRSGETLQQIAETYDVSRERIRQLLKAQGITKKDGGSHKKSKERKAEKKDRSSEYKIKTFGCSIEQWNVFRKMEKDYKDTPLNYYSVQKANARRRGICWDMTIIEWWYIWQESGFWEKRGQGRYVMARLNDEGGYTSDNVRIISAPENSCEYYTVHYDDWFKKRHGV